MRQLVRPHLVRLLAVAACLCLLGIAGQAAYGSSSRIYVVQPGDSLWAIAQANHITVAELAAANGMAPSDILLIGRHLVIPSPGGQAGPPEEGGSSDFCSSFSPVSGPEGVLPALLAASPDRLALRPLFVEWAGYYGVSPALLEAIAWQESGWQEGVVSPAGAVGVGQILPGTARFITGDLVGMALNLESASDNIRMSAAFLGYLSRLEGGALCQTIAAYYEGPGNLAAHGLFPDTEAYVASVEALLPRFE